MVAVIDCGEPKALLNGEFKFLSGSKNEYRSVVQYHCNEPFYSFTKTKQGTSVLGKINSSSDDNNNNNPNNHKRFKSCNMYEIDSS